MQKTEESSVVILDLGDEQAKEDTVNKAKTEVKADAKQAFLLKRMTILTQEIGI